MVLSGLGLSKAGLSALEWSGLSKTLVFIVVSPVLGLVLGFFSWCCWRGPSPLNTQVRRRAFRRGQLFSAALYSLGHGGNDAQKTVGIIFGILAAARMLGSTDHIPFLGVAAVSYRHGPARPSVAGAS